MEAPHPPALRGAAADCINEIVSKRMEAGSKLALVKSMSVVPRCAVWAAGLSSRAAASEGGLRDELLEDEQELQIKLARLLSTLALEVMDSLKRVENSTCSGSRTGWV